MGSMRLNSINDYARQGLQLRVECRCGRVALLDPAELTRACHRRRSSRVIAHVVARLVCAECGGRPPKYWGPA